MSSAARERQASQSGLAGLRSARRLFGGEEVPQVLSNGAFGEEELARAKDWIRGHGAGAAPMIIVVPRMHVEYLQSFHCIPPWDRADYIRRSADDRLRVVREAVEWADCKVGLSNWRGFTCFPSIHACAIRRPIEHLCRLLDTRLFDPEHGVIGAVMPNFTMVSCPVVEPHEDADESRREEPKQDDLLGGLADREEGYMESLGVDRLAEVWKSGFQAPDPTVCVIDTGVDESHPGLQEQIACHALYDDMAQSKQCKYAFDRCWHGTAVSGVIACRPLSAADLGLRSERQSPIGLGVCPRAKIAMVNAVRGERGMIQINFGSLLSAMDWAVENKDHPEWGGFGVINISMECTDEQFGPEVRKNVDAMLPVLSSLGLVPVFAGGNGGRDKDTALTNIGIRVGAMDRNGVPLDTNGPRVALCAPGSNLLCICPPASQGGVLLERRSGSSFATAFVTGVVSLLSSLTRRPALDCVEALIEAKGPEGQISPGAALDRLT